MTRLQRCVSRYCGLPRQHGDDCDGEGNFGGDCRGCLPAVAVDGLYLCRLCVRRLSHDALRAAWLYEALGVAMAARGGPGEHTSGSAPDPGLDLNRAMVAARTDLRALLVAIVRTIATQRGVALPWRWWQPCLPEGVHGPLRPPRRRYDESLTAQVDYITRHSGWLAAHRHADRVAGELRAAVNDPQVFRLAFPASSDRLYIGECPLPGAEGATHACGTRLHQRADDLLVTCPGCGVFGSIEWWQAQIAGDVDAIVDVYAGAAYLSTRWQRPVGADSIRKWGTRPRFTGVAPLTEPDPSRPGQVRTRRDGRGRAQYRLAALLTHAGRLWGPPPGQPEVTVIEFGDIVLTRTAPQVVVEAAPPFARITPATACTSAATASATRSSTT